MKTIGYNVKFKEDLNRYMLSKYNIVIEGLEPKHQDIVIKPSDRYYYKKRALDKLTVSRLIFDYLVMKRSDLQLRLLTSYEYFNSACEFVTNEINSIVRIYIPKDLITIQDVVIASKDKFTSNYLTPYFMKSVYGYAFSVTTDEKDSDNCYSYPLINLKNRVIDFVDKNYDEDYLLKKDYIGSYEYGNIEISETIRIKNTSCTFETLEDIDDIIIDNVVNLPVNTKDRHYNFYVYSPEKFINLSMDSEEYECEIRTLIKTGLIRLDYKDYSLYIDWESEEYLKLLETHEF